MPRKEIAHKLKLEGEFSSAVIAFWISLSIELNYETLFTSSPL